MSEPPIKILYDFTIQHHDNNSIIGRIFELCFTDVDPKDKASKFKWILIFNGQKYDLTFCSMSPISRTLKYFRVDDKGESKEELLFLDMTLNFLIINNDEIYKVHRKS